MSRDLHTEQSDIAGPGIQIESGPLLSVTMRQAPADRAIEAIDRVVAIISPGFEIPADEKGQRDYETCEWLRWIQGRILYAEMQERKRGARA